MRHKREARIKRAVWMRVCSQAQLRLATDTK